jgi:hypothetical protein
VNGDAEGAGRAGRKWRWCRQVHVG